MYIPQYKGSDRRRILLPLLCKVYKVYSHIRYGAFVALEILGGIIMGLFYKIRLFRECFRLAGSAGLIACAKYLCGLLPLDHLDPKSSVFPGGVSDA